jgi:fructose transport system substrate-binding protein
MAKTISRTRLAIGVAGVTAGALALAACSSGSGGGGGGGGGSSAGGGGGNSGSKVGVALILKTLSNPYFVSMQKDAQAEAKKANVNLTVAAGQKDGDTQTQIQAIDNAMSRGDKGIIITENGDAVNTELQKAKAQGLYVIALDTVPTPPNVVDITYATDNEQAGKLIGQYAAAKLNGQKAVIAMLDLFNDQVVSVDIARDHGFLEGMGINPGSTTQNGKEAKTGHYTAGKGGEYQIACHQPTQGAVPGGKTAMEQCLQANPSINLVYTINEPAADGANQAAKAAGKKPMIVSIDGSCNYVNGLVKDGTIAADSAQYPGKMAQLGVKTIAQVARGGSKPTMPSGKNFINTGTNLVTANAISGVTAQTPAVAAKSCWG